MSRTRIKICGLTRPQDVRAAVDHGADAIGFVFYPPSPRAVSIEQAAELVALLPPFVTSVGLFVNAAEEQINAGEKHQTPKHNFPSVKRFEYQAHIDDEECGSVCGRLSVCGLLPLFYQ